MAIITKIILKYLKIQSKEHDLDALRTRNEALEAQIQEKQLKYRKELEDLQVSAPFTPGCSRVSQEHVLSLTCMQTQSQFNSSLVR